MNSAPIVITVDEIKPQRTGVDGGHYYVRGRGQAEPHGMVDVFVYFQTKELERAFEASHKGNPVRFHSQRWEFLPAVGLSLWDVAEWTETA